MRLSVAGVGLGMLFLAVPVSAVTVERTWTAGSGAFATPGNWSPVGVPDDDDIATFNTGGVTETVTMPASNMENLRLRILQGTITINTSEFAYRLNAADETGAGDQFNFDSSSIQVGWDTSGSSALIVEGSGTLHGVTLTAGRSAGSTGAIVVRNENTWLRLDSSLRLSAGGESTLTVEQTADVTAPRLIMSEAGASSLNVTSGGTAQFSEWVEIGRADQATVEVNSGGRMIWTRGEVGGPGSAGSGMVLVRDLDSHWLVSEDLSIGGAGSGMAMVSNGALAVVGRDMFIAREAGSTGSVTVQDGGEWTVQRDLYVGGSTTSAGGTGTLTIGPGGVVNVEGAMETWTDGRVELHGGTLRAGLLWRSGGGGAFDWTAGTLEVTGGELWIAPFGYFGSSLTIGSGRVLRVDGDIDVYSGMAPAAELGIAAGGQVEARSMFLGFFEGESGVMTVAGEGSSVVLSEAMYIGGGELEAGGTGALSVSEGGNVDAGALMQIWDDGGMEISGGVVAVGEVRLRGHASVGGGSLVVGDAIRVSGEGLLSYAGGTIDAPQLQVLEGGMVAMSGGGGKVLTVGILEVDTAGGSGIDVADNRLVVEDGDLGQVRALVVSGYTDGAWTGAGIGSSAAAEEPGRALGVGVDGDDVVVQFTWGGDATLDGAVTIADLGVLAANWQQSDREWFEGDFNYDGGVTIADLGILAANWQAGTSGGMSFEEALAMFDGFDGVVVPEPGVVGLLAGLALCRRRRWEKKDEDSR